MKRYADALAAELARFAARRLPRGLLLAIVALIVAVVAITVAQGEEIHYANELPEALEATAIFFVLISATLGASAVAAEWNTGSLATLLVFDPDRARVLVSKAVAAAIGCVALMAMVFLVNAGALAAGAAVSGSFERQGATWSEVGGERVPFTAEGPSTADGAAQPAPPPPEPGEPAPVGPGGPVELVADDEPHLVARSLELAGRGGAAAALAAILGVAAGILVRRTAAVVAGLFLLYLVGEWAIGALLRLDHLWGPASSLLALAVGPEVLELDATGPYVLTSLAWTGGALVLALAWFSRAEVATGAR